jgi:hypothetical protein
LPTIGWCGNLKATAVIQKNWQESDQAEKVEFNSGPHQGDRWSPNRLSAAFGLTLGNALRRVCCRRCAALP